MNTVIKALLAASALLPAVAQAQNAPWQGRGDRGEAHPMRGDGVPSRERRGDDRARPQDGRQLDRPYQAFGGQVEQPQPYTGWSGQRHDDWGRDDGRRTYSRQPDGSRDPFRGRGDTQPPAVTRGYDNGAGAVRRYRDDRRGIATGNRGYTRSYGTRFDRHDGTWSRDWRRDDRYDYNGYRSYNQGIYRLPRYYAPSGWTTGYRRFGIGTVLSSFLWNRNYWIDDPYAYRLPEAYGPYRWVRYYDDALLIDIRTGAVVDSVYGIFY